MKSGRELMANLSGRELPAELVELLARFVSPLAARAMVRNALARAHGEGESGLAAVLRHLESVARTFVPPGRREEALAGIRAAGEAEKGRAWDDGDGGDDGDGEEFSVLVRSDSDLGATRMFARESCKLVGLHGYAAQKVVTAVSELARNIARYVGDGRVRVCVDAEGERLVVIAEDRGPGIPNLDEILAGRYRSRTGLGRGLIGVKKLADEFDIQTGGDGTRVEVVFRYGGPA
jgi:serine/threonine-protein kinase RsbT